MDLTASPVRSPSALYENEALSMGEGILEEPDPGDGGVGGDGIVGYRSMAVSSDPLLYERDRLLSTDETELRFPAGSYP